MRRKSVILLLACSTAAGAIGLAGLSASRLNVFSFTQAEKEPYTLTIDASNRNNFVQDGNVYRGTFKTGLGNDVTFVTKSVNIVGDEVFLWTKGGGYLQNETALTGLYQIDVSARVLGGENPAATLLRTETRLNPNQTSVVYSGDKSIGAASTTLYSIAIPNEQAYGNFVSMKINENATSPSQLRITSIKFYFSCSNSKNFVKVSSTNETYGTVSIEGYEGKEKVVPNGTEITIHANSLTDYKNGFYCSFKGWRLNGGEEIVSTDYDITFTTSPNQSYVFEAEFAEAEAEMFDHADVYLKSMHSYVTNKNGKYYALASVVDSGYESKCFPTAQERKTNQLFIAGHYNESNYMTHLELNVSPSGQTNYEKFDPTKIQAVIFYLNMETGTPVKVDNLTTTNGTLTNYGGLKDSDDGNKKISKAVWTNFTADKAEVYVPEAYRDINNRTSHQIWIKRMEVIYR